MRIFKFTAIVILVFASLQPTSAEQVREAPSFDCSLSGLTKIEVMICEDGELSKKDYRLSQIYKMAMGKSESKDSLKKIQISWLTKVRNRCNSSECLNNVYEAQEVFLGEIAIRDGKFDLEDSRTGYVRRHRKTNDSESLVKRLNDEFRATNKSNTVVIDCNTVWENHAGKINHGWGGFCRIKVDGKLGEYFACSNEIHSDIALSAVRNEYLMVRHLETECYGG